MWLQTVPSTSRWLQQRIADGITPGVIPHGTWVGAEHQSQGEGRHGRTWESGRGNLYWSGWFAKPEINRLTWFPLVVGWTLRSLILRQMLSEHSTLVDGHTLKLKWPNDLLLEGQKCAGILCEAQREGVLVGIGINLVSAPSIEGRTVAALQSRTPAREWAEHVGEALFRPGALELPLDGKSAEFSTQWLEASAHPIGTTVQIIGAGPAHQEVRVRRIGIHGELIVDTSLHGNMSLWAEEIQTSIKLI